MAVGTGFTAFLPNVDNGYLPLYLWMIAVTAIGNSLQNFRTLHYSRRIYSGRFVPSPAVAKAKAEAAKGAQWDPTKPRPEDSVGKLVPASSTGKDVEKSDDQLTPLAARLFGTWTLVTGVVRLVTAYDINHPALYQLSLLTHVVAAAHYLSELLIYKTCEPGVPVLFPVIAGSTGAIWMALQYGHYVGELRLPIPN